jgi:hypothetical protein
MLQYSSFRFQMGQTQEIENRAAPGRKGLPMYAPRGIVTICTARRRNEQVPTAEGLNAFTSATAGAITDTAEAPAVSATTLKPEVTDFASNRHPSLSAM